MSSRPSACLLGLGGPVLTVAEHRLFADVQPLGFILFARNVSDPVQVRALTAALRDAVGRADAPVLIDQEGGRVARLRPPHWHSLPAAAQIAALDADAAAEAAWLAGRLIAHDCAVCGIDTACAPVLDVLASDVATQVIGDRSFGTTPDLVARLGRRMADGLLAGGVLPVAKHIPGHGRAQVDSHHALPTVDAPLADLQTVDFEPFRALNHLPLAMTAHIDFTAIDPGTPATWSSRLIADIIRGWIGFDGFLLSDDLSMAALGGPLGERAARAIAAGCDAVLHCNGQMAEMRAVADAAGPLGDTAAARWRRAVRPAADAFDPDAGSARLATLTAAAA